MIRQCTTQITRPSPKRMTPGEHLMRDYRIDCQERIRLHLMVMNFEDFKIQWDAEGNDGDSYFDHMRKETRQDKFI